MVPIDDQVITVQVYWTEKSMNEHDAILTGSNALNSGVREGIEPWGPPLEKRLPDPSEMGFKEEEAEHGEMVYEICFRRMLECAGANIKIRWQIARKDTQPYDGMFSSDPNLRPVITMQLICTAENGKERRSNVELAEDSIFELSEGAYNPFPRLSPS